MSTIPTWEEMMASAYRHMTCNPPDLDYARLALDYAREVRIASGDASGARRTETPARSGGGRRSTAKKATYDPGRAPG